MCGNKFPSLVAFLFSWRCLAASTSSFFHAAMHLRPPSVTVPTHASAFNAVAFQPPVIPNARMSLCTQSVHSYSFPRRPLRTAPSRLPNTIRFGSPAAHSEERPRPQKSLLVRNVVSMLSHPIFSRARLYKVIRWSGLLRCAPMMRSKARWCTVVVRSLTQCSWRRVHVLHPYQRASIALAFTIRVLRESMTFGWSRRYRLMRIQHEEHEKLGYSPTSYIRCKLL